MRANTCATASTMLPIASGTNAAVSWKTLVASRFSMASKIARFQTLMPYWKPTVSTISRPRPIESGQARRSPLRPQKPRALIQNRVSR
ncbi:hypothetical protein ACVIHB_009471 [Bradyrhizobium liaoningense]